MKAILTYHSIDESGSVISIPRDVFRRHVAFLASGTVPVVPLDRIAELPDEADAIALTFDDGVASFGEVAAPLLLEHGLPATLFVVADAAGTTNVWRGRQDSGIPVMRLLGWSEIGTLAEAGIAIGAHTCTHPDLTTCADDEAEREIVASKDRLRSELGIEATTFAYPYGAVSAVASDVVARHFRYGCTTRLSLLSAALPAAVLPRLDTYYMRPAGALEAWGTSRFAMRMRFIAGARLARRMITRRTAR